MQQVDGYIRCNKMHYYKHVSISLKFYSSPSLSEGFIFNFVARIGRSYVRRGPSAEI